MILVIVSDLHAGSSVGLWPEGIVDDDGQPLPPNPIGRWLDEQWWRMLDELMATNERIITVCDGDAIQGSHPERDTQLMTASLHLQREAALHYLKPLRELSEEMYMVHGTGWHEGAGGEHVKGLAKDLDCRPSKSGSRLWWQLYLKLGIHTAHITHHISGTKVPFYEASAPLRDMYGLVGELYRKYGLNMPGVDLMIRAHRHRSVVIHKPPRFHIAVTPCWQLTGEFGHKVAPGSFTDIGYLLVEEGRHGLWAWSRVFDLPLPEIMEVEGWSANEQSDVHAG